MRNEIVRLEKRESAPRAAQWEGCALPNRPAAVRATSVIVPFPEHSRVARAESDVAKLVASLELENTELRGQVVELALQILELKERRRWRRGETIGAAALNPADAYG
jgi:hypothetical protein